MKRRAPQPRQRGRGRPEGAAEAASGEHVGDTGTGLGKDEGGRRLAALFP